MELNANFDQRTVVHGDEIAWQDSPMPGVKRRMLDRIGDEVARATSIVSYAPNSRFSPHVHHGGEEFVILEGTFEDEHGAYPKGSYVRNPPMSSHTPGSTDGCIMLVKLWQFDPQDRQHLVLNFDQMTALPDPVRPGIATIALYRDDREDVRIESWEAGIDDVISSAGGAEVFVLGGGFEEGGEHFREHSWLRVPVGGTARISAGSGGARLWVKSGHLLEVRAP